MSVPEARGGASPPSGSTSMVLRRRCRHGLAMLHISAQLHRQQLRPAVRHTAEYLLPSCPLLMPVPLVPLRAPMQLAVVHLCAQKLCASARAAAPCAGPVKP